MKVKVIVTTRDGDEHGYVGEDLGFSLDSNNILIIHEPVKTPVEGGATRRTVALFNNWTNVELEDIG